MAASRRAGREPPKHAKAALQRLAREGGYSLRAVPCLGAFEGL